MTPRRTALAVGGVALITGGACLPYSAWTDEFRDSAHLALHEAVWWVLVATSLVYVTRVERRPLASIGLRAPAAAELGVGCAVGIALAMGLAAVVLVALPALGIRDEAVGRMRTFAATPAWWRVASLARAAVAEEIAFRGYPIERLEELTGRRWVAGGFACAAFTLAHLGFWSWAHLIPVMLGAVCLTLLFLWRRNLWVTMAAHAVVDGAALLASA